jgi:hypothetical protein
MFVFMLDKKRSGASGYVGHFLPNTHGVHSLDFLFEQMPKPVAMTGRTSRVQAGLSISGKMLSIDRGAGVQ